MKSLAALLIAAFVAASASAADAPAPAAPDLKAGAATFKATCVACHGADGNGIAAIPTQPKLAAQHPEYLVKQLEDFKDGKRDSAIMKGFASALSAQDMRNVAWWLAEQKLDPSVASNEKLAERGQAIYRGGIMDRHIPACAACHSADGAGIPVQYPRIGGQFEQYIAAQLEAFRRTSPAGNAAPAGAEFQNREAAVESNDGPVRANSEVMHEIAHYLTDGEIKAVSAYIAGVR